MGVRVLTVLAALAVVIPTASAAPSSTSGATGAVVGQVWNDAKTIQCVRAPCLEPAPGIMVRLVRAGHTVARVTSGVDGRFRLRLPVGTYTVVGARLVGVGLEKPARIVRVLDGRLTRVALRVMSAPS